MSDMEDVGKKARVFVLEKRIQEEIYLSGLEQTRCNKATFSSSCFSFLPLLSFAFFITSYDPPSVPVRLPACGVHTPDATCVVTEKAERRRRKEGLLLSFLLSLAFLRLTTGV